MSAKSEALSDKTVDRAFARLQLGGDKYQAWKITSDIQSLLETGTVSPEAKKEESWLEYHGLALVFLKEAKSLLAKAVGTPNAS